MKRKLKFFVLLILLAGYSCTYESENSKEQETAFIDNFGFEPPKSIKKIKLKTLAIYDTEAHWLSFTYEPTVLAKIISQDKLLKVVETNSPEFQNIIADLKKKANNPKWLIMPNENTDVVFYKKDFLNHTFSEYYLWVDKLTKMTFLYVHYFD